MRPRGLALVVLVSLLAGGCVRPRFMQPAPEREWPETLQRAQAAAEAGRFDFADSTLVAFAERHASSPEASETLFWRALFRLDPANPHASAKDAAEDLTAYLARSGRHQHLVEARALRRAALLADSLAVSSGRRVAAAGAAGAAAVTDKDAEIARLREELKKATDELERIKRRLSTPTP
jgi:hypothetical protein